MLIALLLLELCTKQALSVFCQPKHGKHRPESV